MIYFEKSSIERADEVLDGFNVIFPNIPQLSRHNPNPWHTSFSSVAGGKRTSY